MRFKTSNLREAQHSELVSCVGWASPDDVYSVADDHQVLFLLFLLSLLPLLLLLLLPSSSSPHPPGAALEPCVC